MNDHDLDALLAGLPEKPPPEALVARTLDRIAHERSDAALVVRRPRTVAQETRRWLLPLGYALGLALVGVIWYAGTGGKPEPLHGEVAQVLKRTAQGVAVQGHEPARAASTFASVRRYLDRGELPPVPLVHADAIVDYFQYTDVVADGGVPLGLGVTSMPAPWDGSHRLVRLGVVGRDRLWNEHTPTSLVLALDVAALTRDEAAKSLARGALLSLVATLDDRDSVAVIDIGAKSRVVLSSLGGEHHARVTEIIEQLSCTGGEDLHGDGLQHAYALARSTSGFGRVGHVVVVGSGALRVASHDIATRVDGYVRNGVHTSLLAIGDTLVDEQLVALTDSVRAEVHQLADVRELFLDPMMRTMLPAARNLEMALFAKTGMVRALGNVGTVGSLAAGEVVTALYEVEAPNGKEPELSVRLRFERPDRSLEEHAELAIEGGSIDSTDDNSKVAAAAAAFALALRSEHSKDAVAYLDGAQALLASTELPSIADERDRRLELTRLVSRAREVWSETGRER
jgi:Ca-activated chloride channel family protein